MRPARDVWKPWNRRVLPRTRVIVAIAVATPLLAAAPSADAARFKRFVLLSERSTTHVRWQLQRTDPRPGQTPTIQGREVMHLRTGPHFSNTVEFLHGEPATMYYDRDSGDAHEFITDLSESGTCDERMPNLKHLSFRGMLTVRHVRGRLRLTDRTFPLVHLCDGGLYPHLEMPYFEPPRSATTTSVAWSTTERDFFTMRIRVRNMVLKATGPEGVGRLTLTLDRTFRFRHYRCKARNGEVCSSFDPA